jgi:hypothetical protein
MSGPRTLRRRGWVILLVTVLTLGLATVVSQAATAATRHSPSGRAVTATQISAHYYRLTGWAFDYDTRSALLVRATVNGHAAGTVRANDRRPAVPAAYGWHGSQHGFALNVRLRYGYNRVCHTAVDRGPGHNNRFYCRTITLNNNPTGRFSAVQQVPGGIKVFGGASDPNSRGPISVDVTANGRPLGRVTANYRTYAGHGFRPSFALAAGRYSICVTAVNVRWGLNSGLGCRSITVDFDPAGAITRLAQTPGGFSVSGWAADPDSGSAISTGIYLDATLLGRTTASRAAAGHGNHGYTATYPAPSGTHRVCVRGYNVRFGADSWVACANIALDYNPRTTVSSIKQTANGLRVTGVATDPDVAGAKLTVQLTLDGAPAGTVLAGGGSGHSFAQSLAAGPGRHTVCAVGVNVSYGTGSPRQACASITLNFDPLGAFERLYRRTSDTPNVRVLGWAIDQGSTASISVRATIDGKPYADKPAAYTRPDVASAHPGWGEAHGFAFTIPADAGEHTVCITALNVGTGKDTSLGCHLIIAVHPKVTSVPQAVLAQGGFGGATVTWQKPANDGGAPPTGYVVTSVPDGVSVNVGGTTTSATVIGLRSKTSYTFRVSARNAAGLSPYATSAAVVTQTAPPPQTSPAPVSTSRYIRNIRGASSTDLAVMRAEGIADATANPSGHGYLVLLDIGGQDHYDGGVVLSATTRFISYADLVSNVKSYIAGYASAQKPSAPVMIAIGTNNDMDVTAAAGAGWADRVVDPIVAYARGFTGITVAGAKDIEPGVRGSYTSTRSWLNGYLNATSAPFVFNGSADGCSWTATNRGCNNGWTMAGLYNLAAGAAPTRTINLPQVYNTTMAAQWKYISLTGVNASQPRINFGGALTEWTACDQANSCYSMTGREAWSELWRQLQSSTHLAVGSLPYSTDLRIDR